MRPFRAIQLLVVVASCERGADAAFVRHEGGGHLGADTRETATTGQTSTQGSTRVVEKFLAMWREGTYEAEHEGARKSDAKNHILSNVTARLLAVGIVLALLAAASVKVARRTCGAQTGPMLGSLALCAWYIFISSGLIAFNKYLMNVDRFPYAIALTAIHMSMTSFLSLAFFLVAPSWYPAAQLALGEKRSYVLKSLVPISLLFSASLYMSNEGYHYCNIAFLQFIKEGNLAVVYVMSCLVGLQQFDMSKVSVIMWIFCGCTCCVRGEMHFVFYGLVLQVASLLCECSKNIIAELVLRGKGLNLDPLTFTLFQAPLTLIPLGIALALMQPAGLRAAFLANWHLLLPNSMIAFVLNITLAVIIKRLSVIAFVLAGITKDICIVTASALIFGDKVTELQVIGFLMCLSGVFYWSWLKSQASSNEGKK
eukprot:TRINITY_DN49389_c0_g1_i1.p1 TRINITY_DN49389_c0_g1~~TRINITY_DN49389_c0_g1_i1.p1  ORF type:complete len:449 (-),score=55.87 TRINITY_DN49389_c0_g1_i1:162-1439(-)